MTSDAQKKAKKKWNKQNYYRLQIDLPKQLVVDFKKSCIQRNTTQRKVVLNAIENFLIESKEEKIK